MVPYLGQSEGGNVKANDTRADRGNRTTYEPPPAEPEAERAFLGALLLDLTRISSAAKFVRPEHFAVEQHALLYRSLLRLPPKTPPNDTVLLLASLKNDGVLEKTGGAVYISELQNAPKSSSRFEEYARVVVEAFQRRECLLHAQRIVTEASGGSLSAVAQRVDAMADVLVRRPTDVLIPADISGWWSDDPPELRYIFHGLLPVGVIAGIDAQGGIGKGWIVQQLVCSACTGRALLPSFVPSEAMNVLWIESEDPPTEIQRRFRKIADAFNLDGADRSRGEKNLRLFPGVRFPLVSPAEGTVVVTPHYRELVRHIEQFQPRLIVIDPRSHFFAGDENSNVEVAAFMGHLVALTQYVETGAAILLVHHVAKEREDSETSAAGRGASAGRDAQRVLFSVTKLTPSERTSLGITSPHLYCKLTNTKSNWSALLPRPIFLRRDPYTLPTGGVLREIDAEAEAREISRAVGEHMAAAIAEIVGSNPDNLSITDIWNLKEGKAYRDELASMFPDRATKGGTKTALQDAIRLGKLIIDKVSTRGSRKPRQVPRNPECRDIESNLDENAAE